LLFFRPDKSFRRARRRVTPPVHVVRAAFCPGRILDTAGYRRIGCADSPELAMALRIALVLTLLAAAVSDVAAERLPVKALLVYRLV
jgi:hypothetical protein